MNRLWYALRRRRLQINLVFSFILVGVVLVGIFAAVITSTVTQHATKETVQNFNDRFSLASRMADYIFRNVFEGSFYLYHENADARIALYNKSFSAEDKLKLTRLYRTGQNLSELVESIYFVNPFAQAVCSTNGTLENMENFYDKPALELLSGDIKNVFIIRNLPDGRQVVSFCFSNTRYSDSPSAGGLIVNMDAEKLWDIFNRYDDEANAIWLMNSAGQVLSASNETSAEQLFDDELVSIIRTGTKKASYVFHTVKGQKSLVVYQKSASFGLMFVSVVPYSDLINSTTVLRGRIIVITIVTLFLGLLSSMFFVRLFYNPIRELMTHIKKRMESKPTTNKSEYEYLMDTYDEILNNIYSTEQYKLKISGRKQQLYQLLMGTSTVEEALRANDFTGELFIVVVLRMLGVKKSTGQFTAVDVNLYKFGASNIACELFGERFICASVENGIDYVTLVVNARPGENLEGEAVNVANKVVEKCAEALEQQFSLGMSSIVKEPSSIPKAYQQAMIASDYLAISGPNTVTLWNTIAPVESASIPYPYEIEEGIVNAMKHSGAQGAEQLLVSFVEAISRGNVQDCSLYIRQLATAISQLMRAEAPEEPDARFLSTAYALPKQIAGLDTLKEARELLEEAIRNYCAILDRNQIQKRSELLSGVLSYIEKNYGDPGLSAENIAEHAGYSANYLRKLFKDAYDLSPVDYLLNFRMNKAKQLLIATDLSTKEIAEKVGYPNTKYFYKLFKKETDLTAQSFRNQHKLNHKL